MALIVAKSQKVVMFYKYFGKNSVEIVPKSYKLKVFWLKNLIFFLVFPGFPGATFPGGNFLVPDFLFPGFPPGNVHLYCAVRKIHEYQIHAVISRNFFHVHYAPEIFKM